MIKVLKNLDFGGISRGMAISYGKIFFHPNTTNSNLLRSAKAIIARIGEISIPNLAVGRIPRNGLRIGSVILKTI